MTVVAVIPVRDAAAALEECLSALAAQTRPADEVVIVVAPSTDDSQAVAKAAEGDRVTVLDNPAGDRGSAINLALSATEADVVAMVDAQARLAPDYLAAALAALERHDAAVVGGPMRPQGRTAIGQAMAAALQSPFGIGDSQFHFEGRAREAESVYLGVYRRSAFTTIGRYNPALLRTEDDDLNARIRQAGMRIWLDPAIRSTYLCRNSIGGIFRQYYGYGYWKVALATIRPGAIRPRHVVPALFVIALVAAAVVSVLRWWPALPIALVVYVAIAWVAAALSRGHGPAARVLFPLVTFTMHAAYGIGTLRGIIDWPRLRGLVRRGAVVSTGQDATGEPAGRD